jgi:hypothetical protein
VSRGLWLLVLALGGAMDVLAQPRIELAATPAWNGWARPRRATEVDVRLSADAAMHATLDVAAGRQSVRANVDLEPGRPVRLQIPIEAAEEVAVRVTVPAVPPQRRDLRIAQSESPLLGVAAGGGDPVRLEGFHTVTLGADDLPRNALAYASVDALILDGPTLRSLDRQQIAALIAHAAQCGRIVLVSTDSALRHMLDGIAGCGGRALISATSLGETEDLLKASLATSLAPEISLVGIRELAQPGRAVWDRVLVFVAAYFAIALLVCARFRSLPVLVGMPALSTVAILALLYAIEPPEQLVVWSEGQSGARFGRYQAWQLTTGLVRSHSRVPTPAQLESARSCEAGRQMRFDFDAGYGRSTFAEFDTRLFRQTSVCYAGAFPLERAMAAEARGEALLDVRNIGRAAWPSGVLIANGLVHGIPALGPGESTVVRIDAGTPPHDAPTRIAMTQAAADRPAALWALDPGATTRGATTTRGWLLLTARRP